MLDILTQYMDAKEVTIHLAYENLAYPFFIFEYYSREDAPSVPSSTEYLLLFRWRHAEVNKGLVSILCV